MNLVTSKYKALSKEIAIESLYNSGIEWDTESMYHSQRIDEIDYFFVFLGHIEMNDEFYFDILSEEILEFDNIERLVHISHPKHSFRL